MEKLKSVCKNPWCKSHFFYTEKDMYVVDGIKMPPKERNKCKIFSVEMSNGVTWKDKEYENDRFDVMPYRIRYKMNKYF